MWIIAGTIATVMAAGLGLRLAIARNGPAVVDRIDRLMGGRTDVVLIHREQLGDAPGQVVAVYAPTQSSPVPLPVIVFVHGGGWHSGNPDDYGWAARGLARAGFLVVLAGYRLFPQARYPAMLEDTARAIAWAHANVRQYGGDPGHIVLVGHSAGAYNVVQTALDPQWLAAEGVPSSAVTRVVGMAGPYDFFPFDVEASRNSFGHVDQPETTQPIHHVRAAAPPMLLMAGEADTVVRPRNTRALASALERVSAPVSTLYLPDVGHTDIVLALAAPWRTRNASVIAAITRFARGNPAQSQPDAVQASFPVQPDMR